MSSAFAEQILAWFSMSQRTMPWRGETDPYRVWVSEIIMQQTRVAKGTEYYIRFVEKFPNLQSLADASVDEVLTMWRGLGYYSRARNMHAAAHQIIDRFGGQFPSDLPSLMKIKGIGRYTASAISSICFSEPNPVLDGNVKRVLARLYEISNIHSSKAEKVMYSYLSSLISAREPGNFNQAMMELGATVCTPRNPVCPLCPVSTHCLAFQNKTQKKFPLPKPKKKLRERYFHYYIIERSSNMVWVNKRENKDIWQGLYELPLLEAPTHTASQDEFVSLIKTKKNSILSPFIEHARCLTSQPLTHILSHQRLLITLWHVETKETLPPPYKMISYNDFDNYTMPIILDKFIRKRLECKVRGGLFN